SASASPTPFAGTPATVRLALDWTPNTDHTGFFVARHEGWYRDAGIDLKVLPYATAAPETLLAAHQAECGISFQDSMTFAVAKGADIVSVAAILQKTASAIGVLASSQIQRPRDLDGKIYAGFGYPNEVPTLKAVIQADGGKGDFKVATLDAAAYEALYNHQADFTIPFTAWEGVEATMRHIHLRYFRFSDYGFPEFYQVVLACDRQWLDKDPDAARRFAGATGRGVQFAAGHPDDAAAMLVSGTPGVFPFVLPAPSDVLGSLWRFRDEAIRHSIPAVVETAVGFSASIAAATAVAVGLDRAVWARRAVEPLLVGSQTIPIVAIAPLVVVWFGFGLLPKVLVVILVTFFPITIALLDGFASTA